MRSVFGGTLPLAGPSMYEALTPQWAGTMLGLLEVCLIPIPFVFYRYGHKIRSKSRVIRQMQEDQATNERKPAKGGPRAERHAREMSGENAAGVVEDDIGSKQDEKGATVPATRG
jgi:hypothetical protein